MVAHSQQRQVNICVCVCVCNYDIAGGVMGLLCWISTLAKTLYNIHMPMGLHKRGVMFVNAVAPSQIVLDIILLVM